MGAKGGEEEQEVEAQLRLGSHSSDASFQEDRGVDPVLPGRHFCLRGIGPLVTLFSPLVVLLGAPLQRIHSFEQASTAQAVSSLMMLRCRPVVAVEKQTFPFAMLFNSLE